MGGKFRKSVLLKTNDPQRPLVELWALAESVEKVAIRPLTMRFGQVEASEGIEKRVEIQIKDPNDGFGILSASVDSPFMRATIAPSEKGAPHVVLVRLMPPLPMGSFSATLSIRTDSPQWDRLTVPIRGMVVGMLTVSPLMVYCTSRAPLPDPMIILIGPGTVKSFKVTGVRVPVDGMEAEILENGEFGYAVRLSHLPPQEKLWARSVVICTDVPGVKEIPVRFVKY